jgi:hypothetical protein
VFGFFKNLAADLKRISRENAERRVLASWTIPWPARVVAFKAYLLSFVPIALRTSFLALAGICTFSIFLRNVRVRPAEEPQWLVITAVAIGYCWLFPAISLVLLKPRKIKVSTIGIEFGREPKQLVRWSSVREIRYADSSEFPGIVEVAIDQNEQEPRLALVDWQQFNFDVLPVLRQFAPVRRTTTIVLESVDRQQAADQQKAELHTDLLWCTAVMIIFVSALAALAAFRPHLLRNRFDIRWLPTIILLVGPGTVAMLLRYGKRFFQNPPLIIAMCMNMLSIFLLGLIYVLIELWRLT